MSEIGKDWVAQFMSKRSAEVAEFRRTQRQGEIREFHPQHRRPTKPPARPAIVRSLDDLPQLLTPKEVAAHMRFRDPETVVGLIHRGELEAEKHGREWRISVQALADYRARKRVG